MSLSDLNIKSKRAPQSSVYDEWTRKMNVTHRVWRAWPAVRLVQRQASRTPRARVRVWMQVQVQVQPMAPALAASAGRPRRRQG